MMSSMMHLRVTLMLIGILINFQTMAREIDSDFRMLQHSSPQEALLYVFSLLLKDGISKSYGVYYIWEKEGGYFTEVESGYHSASKWRALGYKTYDIIEIKNYIRTYFHDTKEEVLTGFMFNGKKFFSEDISFQNTKNTIHL